MNAYPPKTRPLRERIIQAAHKLFDEQGILHVTVDRIATEAGTTKMGVYRHFASKDALVEHWLTDTITQYQSALDAIVQKFYGNPCAQLSGWSDHIAGGLQKISYRGCPFANTLAEIPDRKNLLRMKIERHKAMQADRIVKMCRDAGISDAESAAAEVTFLLEGAQVAAQNGSVRGIEKHIGEIMQRILGADRGQTPAS